MTEKVSVAALVIIKGNSVRVPGKNFRALGQKPLFQWMLDTLCNTPVIDRVIINTDAQDKLLAHGLKPTDKLLVFDRSEALCGDHITANTLLPALMAAQPAKTYVMTHVTSPFLSSQTIERAVSMFNNAQSEGTADSLFGVTRYQSRFYGAKGKALNHNPKELVPTQDLPPVWEENSSIYVFTDESFEATGSRIGLSPLMFETPKHELVDIDDEEDWAFAQRYALGQQRLNE